MPEPLQSQLLRRQRNVKFKKLLVLLDIFLITVLTVALIAGIRALFIAAAAAPQHQSTPAFSVAGVSIGGEEDNDA